MNQKIYFVILYVLVGSNFSFSWSSTINGMLRTRTFLPPVSGGVNTNLVESVVFGAQMAMDQCKQIFKWDRWNCPQSSFSRQVKHLATREIAYTEAIVAAGIVYSITRNCSKGEIQGCGCDPLLSDPLGNITEPHEELIKNLENHQRLTERDWTWGGCSDDTEFGEKIVMDYLEGDKHNDVQAFVSRQNNKVGRHMIEATMIKKCRCHGVSGSCTLQTCWKEMAPFSEIALKLKERYHNAVRFSFDQLKGAVTIGNSARQVPEIRDIVSDHLVYLEESPDYCKSHNSTGWPGTKGRTCSKTNLDDAPFAEKRSCRNLCRSCGYKVRKQKRKIAHRCNCKFMWCCEVKCDICVENVDQYFCD